VNKAYQEIYEEVTSQPYVSTLYTENQELPQWILDLEKTADGNKKLMELSARLCEKLTKDGARLLLDPVCVRKM
ncbi:MAG: hypothetical protein K2M91_07155, partial [Lachnospiraceae bacterium]|nr:hypothetical protein [Lachnospiraceae bacterium]